MKKIVELTYTVEVEWDESTDVVSRGLDPEWQRSFYSFADEDDVVAHLAGNVGVKFLHVDNLDGWADVSHRAFTARVTACETVDVRDAE